LNASPNLRVAAFCVIATAALVGVATRLSKMTTVTAEPAAFELKSLDLRVGEPIGNAAFDGVRNTEPPGVRLRVPGCIDSVFVVPIEILSPTAPQIADNTYSQMPYYRSTDVYGGRIRKDFSHLSKVASYLAARVFVDARNVDINYFLRVYAPSGCDIEPAAYLAWAAAILKLASAIGPAGSR
jgi:hypothetical protein